MVSGPTRATQVVRSILSSAVQNAAAQSEVKKRGTPVAATLQGHSVAVLWTERSWICISLKCSRCGVVVEGTKQKNLMSTKNTDCGKDLFGESLCAEVYKRYASCWVDISKRISNRTEYIQALQQPNPTPQQPSKMFSKVVRLLVLRILSEKHPDLKRHLSYSLPTLDGIKWFVPFLDRSQFANILKSIINCRNLGKNREEGLMGFERWDRNFKF